MNFIAGETSSDASDESFPIRTDALLQGSLFFVGGQRRGQRQSQAPKQVLGVPPLQAICEE
jgi:hypothetical protein